MAPHGKKHMETASQTAGPFVHIGLCPGAAGLEMHPEALGTDIAGPHAAGERITVQGVIRDGDGMPLSDAVIEIWQANADGIYAHPEGGGTVEEGFRGWGRAVADFESGEWSVDTVKPGAIGPGQAPHLNLWIVARGINLGLHTRLYFADEADANARDAVLNHIVPQTRGATLIAAKTQTATGTLYRFDIHLQGAKETVFFDI